MAETSGFRSSAKEEFAIYTGEASPRFSPLLAGITWPNPSYEIKRIKGECYVFEYVLEGRGYVCQGDTLLTMEKGDAYVLHQGEYHHYFSDRKEPWKKIWFNVSGSLVRHLLSDYGLDTIVKIPSFGDEQYLTAIYHTMKKQRMPGSASHPYEQNLMLPLSVEDMAGYVHLSRSRAIHLFKEVYGITPYHYYLTQKGELACTLLKCTTLSIQEISDRLGFSDYHHFSGFFRKWYGVSPSQYR